MVIAQYSYNKYRPYDGCSSQYMYMIVSGSTQFVRGLRPNPLMYPEYYTSNNRSFLTNFRLEFIY